VQEGISTKILLFSNTRIRVDMEIKNVKNQSNKTTNRKLKAASCPALVLKDSDTHDGE
jgi:hypothetical protein